MRKTRTLLTMVSFIVCTSMKTKIVFQPLGQLELKSCLIYKISACKYAETFWNLAILTKLQYASAYLHKGSYALDLTQYIFPCLCENYRKFNFGSINAELRGNAHWSGYIGLVLNLNPDACATISHSSSSLLVADWLIYWLLHSLTD